MPVTLLTFVRDQTLMFKIKFPNNWKASFKGPWLKMSSHNCPLKSYETHVKLFASRSSCKHSVTEFLGPWPPLGGILITAENQTSDKAIIGWVCFLVKVFNATLTSSTSLPEVDKSLVTTLQLCLQFTVHYLIMIMPLIWIAVSTEKREC